MIDRYAGFRSIVLVATWFVITVGSVAAHNGEDHAGGSSDRSVWLGAVGVVVVIGLVYGLVRSDGSVPASVDSDDEVDR